MDFSLSEDSLAMADATREVVNDLLKLESEFHASGEVPSNVDPTLRKMGYCGMAIPEQFGGTETDKVTSALVQLELARLPPQFWPKIRSALGPTPHALLRHGTPKQQERWLPGIASGEMQACIALTEPGAGSDVVSMGTTAVRKGDKWVLNGSKTFISNAATGSVFMVMAKTDRSKGRDGVSAFLVEPGTPGFTMNPPMQTMGWMQDGLYELSFVDCEIPAESLLGEEGRGFYYALEGLSEARINVGCQAVGGGDIALEHALQYAKERHTFGVPIASHQAIQHMLADMSMDQHAARLLLLEAAWGIQNGGDIRLKSSFVKVFCTEAAGRTADKAVQIFGGAGYIRGMVVERVYRDIRVLRIYEGASEIHRNMIAKHLLR